ncbi:glycerol-3-phosphate acyltransferase [Candidatus Marinimicrobia bacterium]|jgi:acyl phosphate:glycerol-3-phosphate acyltransferase|nr:glycerol-3-phosphate acyltransferase [Candidatus Neomarinimicrobiota bacterium]
MIQLLINFILSYLVGSISGSMVLGKIKGLDIRTMGSGNAGGTNALRSVGPLFALGVIFIDIGKGVFSVLIISEFTFISQLSIDVHTVAIICGVAAVLGHVYPIYYNFKGGKGAGTLIGIIGSLFPVCMPYVFISWLLVVITTGFVGLATIIGSIVLMITVYAFYPIGINSPLGYFSISMAIFIIFTHRSNIIRMINNQENRFEKVMIFKKVFKK